jgi:AcrR family transcriptional regulator
MVPAASSKRVHELWTREGHTGVDPAMTDSGPRLGERLPRRETYRHGDLRRALLRAGVELARDGGPDAVVLREATRRVGVAPNAAYRHFTDRQALLEAVCAVAQSELAVAMEDQMAQVGTPGENPGEEAAWARLRAVGHGYLRFARLEPGLFRTAFSVPGDMSLARDPELAGQSGNTAFQLLSSTLDELAETGALSRERRVGAEVLAWSAVHGLATLLIDGPLREADPDTAEAMGARVISMVEQGL